MNRMQQLVQLLNEYSYRYYTLDEPIVADAEYDKLYDELLSLEKAEGHALSNSPTKRVGDVPIKEFAQIKHLGRLFSLDKCQSKQQLSLWLEKIQTACGQMPKCSVEYKFDGLTINMRYEGGQLVSAATRGNGIVGEDVTAQVKTINCVPLSIEYKGVVEVQGEGIMRLSQLKKYNAQQGVTPLKNARNAVAGAIRNLDPKVTASRNLDVICYNVNFADRGFESGDDMIEFLRQNHFKLSKFYKVTNDPQAILSAIDAIEESRDKLDFLIDGAVLKIDDIAIRDELGFTEKFPRWAMAFKYAAEEATTIVRDVIWQVSRTGKLNPLAILEPVDLAGVNVSRATLSNLSEIKRKDIQIGSRVFIRRSGDVIPEILGVAEHLPHSKEVEAPTICPACGAKVDSVGVFLKCSNVSNCAPAIVAKLEHFTSKGAMDIDGLSEKTIETLYNEIHLATFSGIYRLSASDLNNLDGFKDKKIANIIGAIENSKDTSLERLLFGIGIANIGKKAAKQLEQKYHTLEAFMNCTAEELVEINDFGAIMANSVVNYLRDENNVKELLSLIELGVKPRESEKVGGVFSGKNIVLTGSLTHIKRGEATALITQNGGQVSDSVSKTVNLVIVGADAGSKLEKAKKLGIEIIDEEEFCRLLGR